MWSCLNEEWLAGMGVFLWKLLSVKEQEAYFFHICTRDHKGLFNRVCVIAFSRLVGYHGEKIGD